MADRSYLAGMIPPPTPGATVNSNLNLFDLPPEGFRSYLNELSAQGVNTDELMRQYRRANSPFSGFFDWAINSERDIANEGRTTAGAGLFSKEAGTTGMDALASTRIEPANFIAGLLSGGAQAVDAPAAAAQGLIPAPDMQMEALGTAGFAQLGGAGMAAPRGSLRSAAWNDLDMYHGTPDVRDVRSAGGFSPRSMSASRISDIDEWNRLSAMMENVPHGSDEYFNLLDQRSALRPYQTYSRPVFMTPDRQMASTYADASRAWDYQNAEPGVLDVRSSPQNILDVNAGGSEFRGISKNAVRTGLQNAGVSQDRIDEAMSRFIFADRGNGKISTDDLSVVAQELGFDAVDVSNVKDAYSGGGQAGRVRMVFDPESVSVASANRDATTGAIASAASSGGFDEYLRRVNPQGYRVDANDRPNLMMGDMYGMLPRNARRVGERDGVSFYQAPDGASYATAFNPDVGEMDVVGYAMPRGDMTDLAVVNEMQGRGIGSELQYLMRSQDPYAPTGGLTEAGEASLRRTYNRLRDQGIVSANASPLAGILAMPNEEERNRQLGMLFGGYR